MLKKLVHDKINEVFLEYQKANNITSGDIKPYDAFTLEQIEDSLEALIRKVVAYQPKGLPETYAELEYTSEQLETDPEAIEGAKFDDMNYLHYTER